MSDALRMTAEEAEDFTQALGSVLTGGYRFVFQGWRLGVPQALGLEVQEWVETRLGGYIKMAEKDRQKAIAELQAERTTNGEKRMSTRELAGVLGVSHQTVKRDAAAVTNFTVESEGFNGDSAETGPAVTNVTAEGLAPAPPATPQTEGQLKTAARRDRNRDAEAKRIDRDQREASVYEVASPDLRIGTLSKALADVTDLDLVLTDPPYPREFLPAWSELALWAASALKPGAWLVAYSGQYHLPDVLQRLSAHLEYQWLGWVQTPGPNVAVHQKPIQSGGKPLLLFSNGKLRKPFSTRSFADIARADGRTRELHAWQQDEAPFAYFADALTERGEYVADPFLGSGTTAVVCGKLARRFVGCDVDEIAVRAAQARLVT